MDIIAVNIDLLGRLRAALRRQMAITTGLAAEIVEAHRHLVQCAAEEREAEHRLSRDPHRGLFPEEIADLHQAEGRQRRSLAQQEREAGRPAVTEQTVLQSVVDNARRGGADPAIALQQYAAAATRRDPAAFAEAYRWAAEGRTRAERNLRELEAERARQGTRAGLLRQTVQEAETWLRANGMATEIAA